MSKFEIEMYNNEFYHHTYAVHVSPTKFDMTFRYQIYTLSTCRLMIASFQTYYIDGTS